MPGYRKKYTFKRKPAYKRKGRKLQQRQVGPYGARGVGAVGALARGVNFAYRNRGAIQGAARFVKRKFTGPRGSRTNTTRPYASNANFASSASHTINSTSRVVGRYPSLVPNRLLKMINMGMLDRTDKFQGVTNFDTNAGFFTLANRESIGTSTEIVLPMHAIPLTQFGVNGIADANRQCLYSIGWADPTSGVVTSVPLQGQNAANDAARTYWTDERPFEHHYTDSVLHDWTSVKLNLYGARLRSTTFYIDFIKFTDEEANFVTNATGYSDRRSRLVDYLTGHLMYSNLIVRETKAKRYINIVKSFKYSLPAETSLDLNIASGKIKNVNIFMRHGRIFDMNNGERHRTTPEENPLENHAQTDMADYTSLEVPNYDVKDKAKLYMIIRAFSPQRRGQTEAAWATVAADKPIPETYITRDVYGVMASVNTEPSYDIVVRNKYSYIPKQKVTGL